ncbi:hypothetical protein Dxin01_04334 [Deinococcus xinjiangensis]|uniref:Uncharacterized protein n=1 Tax=Deinococcus xinjiangensis TaxID=457454 RepID=A0ABP9VH57_9DEIO
MLVQFAKFAEQMSIAQRMFRRKTKIGVPSVVNHDAHEVSQYTS